MDSSLSITEEFLALRPMHSTITGQDPYEEVSRCVKMGLPWEKLVGLTTDEAPAMCGHRSGLVARMRRRMREENVTHELTEYHCIIHQESLCGKALKMEHVMSPITRAINFIRAKGLSHRQFKAFLGELDTEYGDLPYHTEVRWLSQAKVLQRCFELREEICLFMESKGKDTAELRDETFLFKTKLSLWEMRIENLSHIPSCRTMKEKLSTAVFPSAQFANTVNSTYLPPTSDAELLTFLSAQTLW